MLKNIFKTRTSQVTAALIFAVILSVLLYTLSPYLTDRSLKLKLKIEDISDILFTASIALHLIWLIMLKVLSKKDSNTAVRMPDFFTASTLMFFLFNYLFAANAGLEYIQRFAETSDVLSFAPDTGTERLLTAFLFMPILFADIFASVKFRKEKLLSFKNMRLPLTLLSSILYAFAFPSFINLEGWGFLIFIAFIPLLIVFKYSSIHRGIFYGIAFGIFQTMIINYWLATFSLVSLQFVTALYSGMFTFFMAFAVYIYKKSKYGWLLFPFAWIVFEWARSSGFSAYPWCLTGSALYSYLPLIQIASLTGIWGISFMVLLINTAFAEIIFSRINRGKRTSGSENIFKTNYQSYSTELISVKSLKQTGKYVPLITASLLTAGILIFGLMEIKKDNEITADRNISLSLIQQNADPRKTSYEESFNTLKTLTDTARSIKKTDLVVWSETAYVPNIRRWGSLDKNYNSLTKLTHKFLEYQKTGRFFLVTGNDDYEIITDTKGDVSRKEYNASVYFSDTGKRIDTYRKIRLVPFTEYFPFKKQLPWLYNILMEMDVNLWEPGIERTVFNHPDFRFSTPICFEDLFPDYVRSFVNNGADIIINISNDYWSLTETEGMQHFINGLFRAVENRRYVVRATASGLTGVIDRKGKIIDTVPFYEEHYLNTEIPLTAEKDRKLTFYTKYGDWFPMISLIVFILSFLYLSGKSLLNKNI